MSSFQYEKAAEVEIERLNKRIDYKILHGISYSDEARRHKMLRAQIQKARQRRPSLFGQFGQILRFSSR
jgi:hypothetical protein